MPRRGHHQEKIIRSLKQADARVDGGESCREHGIRIEETYVRVKGKWRYLYRALDSTGATIDFFLSTNRDAEAARRFLAKALAGAKPSHRAAHQHQQICRLSARPRPIGRSKGAVRLPETAAEDQKRRTSEG